MHGSQRDARIRHSGALDFPHGLLWACYLPEPAQAQAMAEENFRRCLALLEHLDLHPRSDGLMPPFNLLMTRDWLWIVPRSREHWGSISINALGFAGSLLVKDETQLQELEAGGLSRALHGVVSESGT